MNALLTPRNRMIISAALGLLATLGFSWHLRVTERRRHENEQLETVLVAKRYLAPRTALSPAELDRRKIPILYLEPGAITAAQAEEFFKGAHKNKIPILKGEQITKQKTTDGGGDEGISVFLPEGGCAMSFRVPSERALNGALRAGEWVGLFSVGDNASFFILRAKILSVHDESEGDKSRLVAAGSGDVIVTLALRLKEAGQLALALERAKVAVCLLSADPDENTAPFLVSAKGVGLK